MNRPVSSRSALSALSCGLAAALLAACSSPPPRQSERPAAVVVPATVEFGQVQDIVVVRQEARTSGGGAVLGAIVGGVLGNQVGGGTGKALATGAGVVGGAVVGNQIEKRNKREDEVFRVVVRFDNGSVRQYDYDNVDGLRVGDRVKLEGKQLYRV